MATHALHPPAAFRLRRAGDLLASTILVLAVALAVAVAAGAAAGVTPRVELSDSMRPVLRAGDVLWVRAIAARDARAGDVVAFVHPDRGDVVLHRVTAVHAAPGGLAFTTRGDANSGSESWSVPADGRIGRYTGLRIPAVGRLAGTAALPVIAILSALALAGVALRRVWR